MLARLAHVVARHRWKVIGAWIVLTLFGGFAAGQVSKRWYQSFSIPGKSAYEANQRTLKTFGTGVRPPDVVVFHTAGDATKSARDRRCDAARSGGDARRARRARTSRRTTSCTSRRTGIRPSRRSIRRARRRSRPTSGALKVRAAAARGLPSGIQVEVTGHDPLEEASTHGGGGGNVLVEAVIGGLGAIVILLFVFGTLPAILMPVAVAAAAILNTFTLVWALTYITNVSIIVAVPDRARRPRRRDRLRAADDLPLPRRAARGRGRRDGARGDDDPRRPLGDRLGLDRRGRPPVDDPPAAAVHPLDRDRRDADPGRLRARGDHADAGAARGARRAHQQRAAAAEAVRRPRPSRGRRLGALGALRPAPALGRRGRRHWRSWPSSSCSASS